jgi:hypothetical protein
MPTIRPEKVRTLVAQEHARFLKANPDLAGGRITNRLDWEIFIDRLLRRAIQTDDSRAYSVILQGYLIRRGLKPPKGVFSLDLVNPGYPGRRHKIVDAVNVWLAYHGMQHPTFGKVASKVFPSEYEKNHKAASDRVRQLYRSFEKLLPMLASGERKLEIISSRD